MTDDIETQVENTLDKIRPFLKRDGGDVELYGVKDGVVYVKMSGACEGCLYASDDITSGVEIILVEEVPGIISVDATGKVPQDIMDKYLAKKEKEIQDKETMPKDTSKQ